MVTYEDWSKGKAKRAHQGKTSRHLTLPGGIGILISMEGCLPAKYGLIGQYRFIVLYGSISSTV